MIHPLEDLPFLPQPDYIFLFLLLHNNIISAPDLSCTNGSSSPPPPPSPIATDEGGEGGHGRLDGQLFY